MKKKVKLRKMMIMIITEERGGGVDDKRRGGEGGLVVLMDDRQGPYKYEHYLLYAGDTYSRLMEHLHCTSYGSKLKIKN